MTADAIRRTAAALMEGGEEPPTAEDKVALVEAVGEAVDIVLGFFADVHRIAQRMEDVADHLGTIEGDMAKVANAADALGECVDDNCQPAIVVKAIVAHEPATDD